MKIFISDFAANQTVSTTFLVKSKELRSKKTGGQFALLTLSDRSGDISGQWWDNFEDSYETFDRDDIVFARGLVNAYRNHLQLSIHRVRRCEEREIDLTHYFPTTKFCVEAMFTELMGIVQAFQNPHLRQLLENIFADEATVRKFKRAPAAKTMHHPYLGGLLEHTLSLVRLCRKVAEHYSGIDLDLLQTGAVLHDFGKIDELSYERGFGYTNEGQMIGHPLDGSDHRLGADQTDSRLPRRIAPPRLAPAALASRQTRIRLAETAAHARSPDALLPR